MTKRLPRPCAVPGCPGVTTERYCPNHQHMQRQAMRQYDQQRGSAAQRGYDARWRRIRAMVLAEEPLCRECMQEGKVVPATEVHHKDGDARNMARDNLVGVCHECHSRHTAKHQAFGRKG